MPQAAQLNVKNRRFNERENIGQSRGNGEKCVSDMWNVVKSIARWNMKGKYSQHNSRLSLFLCSVLCAHLQLAARGAWRLAGKRSLIGLSIHKLNWHFYVFAVNFVRDIPWRALVSALPAKFTCCPRLFRAWDIKNDISIALFIILAPSFRSTRLISREHART